MPHILLENGTLVFASLNTFQQTEDLTLITATGVDQRTTTQNYLVGMDKLVMTSMIIKMCTPDMDESGTSR